MCDTLGKIVKRGQIALFAKNSDREKEEAQIVLYIPAKEHEEKKLKTTYLTIAQVPKTAAVFLSKPAWMWGAEMGVNEYGVCIGNEALYPRNYDNPATGLLGMDLLRLALERSTNAKQALAVIIELLEKYGQGGICSKKNKDLYDNAYLIMDINECYILETKNKHWAYIKVKKGVISNTFSIKHPDKYSDIKNLKKVFDREGRHSGDYRRKLMKKQIGKLTDVKQAINILRLHNKKDLNKEEKKFSLCMHGEYSTTGSMVVKLQKGAKPKIYFTATSHPCKSLFLPYTFGEKILKPINSDKEEDCSFWQNFSCINFDDVRSYTEKLEIYQNKIIDENLSLKESLNLRYKLVKQKKIKI